MTEAQFPHCNSEVLHAPRTCRYCDGYPDRQAMRAASGTPFTPAEANGWYGNVAHPAAAPPGWIQRIARGLAGVRPTRP